MAPPPTLGLILAGGRARRMGGGDKPLLRLAGRTLLDRVTERLAPQCGAGLVLSANGDPGRFASFPGPVLSDDVLGNPGPLAGILAALDFAAQGSSDTSPHPQGRRQAERPAASETMRTPEESPLAQEAKTGPAADPQDTREGAIIRVVSVSGDAPFIPRDLVARLYAALDADDTRIALAASQKQHYTVALWPIALRLDLRRVLVEREERRVGAFIERHGSVVVSWPSQPFDPFHNINEPADLAAAEAVLADPAMAALL